MTRSDMPIGDAVVTAVMGWAVVFLGIALLVVVVVLVGKLMTAKKHAPAPIPVPASGVAETAPAPKPAAPAAPGVAGDVKLYDTSDRDAADELKLPLNELRFISIKEVHKK